MGRGRATCASGSCGWGRPGAGSTTCSAPRGARPGASLTRSRMSNVGKSKTGRKTKLSPDLQKRLLDAIAAGNYIHTACAAVGIGESTYFKWIERGRAGESPYREFMEALTRAEQQAVVSLVDLVASPDAGAF